MTARPWEVWDDDRAVTYARHFGESHAPVPMHAARMRFAASWLVGRTVLDVGCGIGHLCGFLPRGVQYCGVDNSAAMLAEARRAWPQLQFAHGDVYNLADGPVVDTVCCHSVLIHLPDLRVPLENLWSRATRRLVFSMPLGRIPKTRTVRLASGDLLVREVPLAEVLDCIERLPAVQEVVWQQLPGFVIPGNTYFKVCRDGRPDSSR